MDPEWGDPRWPATLNSYLYGRSDPIHHRDPTGRFNLVELELSTSIVAVLATIGALVGLRRNHMYFRELYVDTLRSRRQPIGRQGFKISVLLGPVGLAQRLAN